MASSSKKKIIFFCGNMSHSGGTERVLSIIANGLSGRGYPVSIISLWGNGNAFFSLCKDIPVYWIEKERNKKGILGNLFCLRTLILHERPDVLIDVDMILGCYSFFLKRLRPELFWISWEHFNYYYHFRKSRLLRKLVRKVVCRYADWLVVLTERDKRNYQKYMKLHCGISHIYDPVPYESPVVKRKEYPVVFAAGRLTREKGFDLLIRSWSLLERKYPQWRLIVAGAGADEKKLKRSARRAGLKRLYFIGTVRDIEKYYKKAAFFVLPSRDEGFGMVLVEAMSFSIPVVSFDCKAGPEEIIENGKTGFLVEEKDTSAFAEKMEELMGNKNLRRKMGMEAGKSVKRFDKEVILDQWESLLGERMERGYDGFGFNYCSGL